MVGTPCCRQINGPQILARLALNVTSKYDIVLYNLDWIYGIARNLSEWESPPEASNWSQIWARLAKKFYSKNMKVFLITSASWN